MTTADGEHVEPSRLPLQISEKFGRGSPEAARSNSITLLSDNISCRVELMLSPDLLAYIKDQRAKGTDDTTIKSSLLSSGWEEGAVNMALSLLTPAPTPTPTTETTPPPSGGKRKKLIPLIVLILLLAAVGSVYGYMTVFQSPLKKVENALKKAEDVKSVAFDGEMKIQVATDDLLGIPEVQSNRNLLPGDSAVLAAKQITLGISFAGKIDGSNQDEPNYELNLGLDMGALVPGASKLEVDVRGVAKDFYFRFADIPKIGLYDFSFLANKWIKTDLKDLEKQLAGTSSSTSTLDSLESEQLNKIFAKYKIIKEVKNAGTETVTGVETAKYQIVIDKEELVASYREFYKSMGTLTDTQIEDTLTMFKNLDIQSFDVNIGKGDQMIYRFLISGTFTQSASSKGKISLLMNFKDYNKPVKIEAPTSAKSFEEIIGDFQRSLLQSQYNIYPDSLRSTTTTTTTTTSDLQEN